MLDVKLIAECVSQNARGSALFLIEINAGGVCVM